MFPLWLSSNEPDKYRNLIRNLPWVKRLRNMVITPVKWSYFWPEILATHKLWKRRVQTSPFSLPLRNPLHHLRVFVCLLKRMYISPCPGPKTFDLDRNSALFHGLRTPQYFQILKWYSIEFWNFHMVCPICDHSTESPFYRYLLV